MKKTLGILLVMALVLSVVGVMPTAMMEEEPIELTLMCNVWNEVPMAAKEDDQIRQYLYERYGAWFTLMQPTDPTTELSLAFASDNPPDLVQLTDYQLDMFWKQEVVLDDWTPFLDRMPNTVEAMGETQMKYYTEDGKLKCVNTKGGMGQVWTWCVRQEWLDNLGIAMPDASTTIDDLLDIARAFTFKDPDGDGVDNTYAFTAAGNGEGVNELGNMLAWFGPTDFYVTEDGQVSHPILDGNYDKYADLLHTIVSEGLIDPDWYTQGWDDRKPNMAQGMFGILWYPVVALNQEVSLINGVDINLEDGSDNPEFLEKYANNYSVLPSINGGKLPAADFKGNIRTVSVEAAEDEKKMDLIIRFLEDSAYPQELHEILYGGPMQPFSVYDKMEVLDDGTMLYTTSLTEEEQTAYKEEHPHWQANSMGTWNWMNFLAVYNPAKIGVTKPNGTIDDASESSRIFAAQNAIGLGMDKWPSDGKLVIQDATLEEEVRVMTDEYLFNRIMGNDTVSFEAFQQQWLDAGGQTMLDNATETFREAGLID